MIYYENKTGKFPTIKRFTIQTHVVNYQNEIKSFRKAEAFYVHLFLVFFNLLTLFAIIVKILL